MADRGIGIRAVDFSERTDVARYLALLDAYARDPMGGGQPLPVTVLERLPRDLAAQPGAHALLAEQGDRAIGFVTCFLGYSTFRARPLINIHDIAVLPAWRGQSVAHRLLDAVAQLGRELGCCGITLEVREDNERARAVYRQAGFAPATCSLFMERSL